jgi:RHS repeat-associated protein
MLEQRTLGTAANDNGTVATLHRYIYSNHLSSASLELDDSGNIITYEEYHPYGTTSYSLRNAAINATAKRYRFTGKERDEESGFNYHSARYYLPWLGRWCAVDALESKFAGVSGYCYSFNNPVMWNDLNGMCPGCKKKKSNSFKSSNIYQISVKDGTSSTNPSANTGTVHNPPNTNGTQSSTKAKSSAKPNKVLQNSSLPAPTLAKKDGVLQAIDNKLNASHTMAHLSTPSMPKEEVDRIALNIANGMLLMNLRSEKHDISRLTLSSYYSNSELSQGHQTTSTSGISSDGLGLKDLPGLGLDIWDMKVNGNLSAGLYKNAAGKLTSFENLKYFRPGLSVAEQPALSKAFTSYRGLGSTLGIVTKSLPLIQLAYSESSYQVGDKSQQQRDDRNFTRVTTAFGLMGPVGWGMAVFLQVNQYIPIQYETPSTPGRTQQNWNSWVK